MKVQLSDGAELFYTIDDFTDPWTQPETVVLHHGMAKNHKLWYAWIPILASITASSGLICAAWASRQSLRLAIPGPWRILPRPPGAPGPVGAAQSPPHWRDGRGLYCHALCDAASGPPAVSRRLHLPCDLRCAPYGKCRGDRA